MALDQQVLPLDFSGAEATAHGVLKPNATGAVRIVYRSQGQDNWIYKFSSGDEVARVKNLHLLVKTDFAGFDFPDSSLSPTEKRQTSEGWELKWDYRNLVSGFNIALRMPQKLQPGPLAGRISCFAPVPLFFFFFLVFFSFYYDQIDVTLFDRKRFRWIHKAFYCTIAYILVFDQFE